MFTGGTIWLLTHGQMALPFILLLRGEEPRVFGACGIVSKDLDSQSFLRPVSFSAGSNHKHGSQYIGPVSFFSVGFPPPAWGVAPYK